jgi:hypothetical protein
MKPLKEKQLYSLQIMFICLINCSVTKLVEYRNVFVKVKLCFYLEKLFDLYLHPIYIIIHKTLLQEIFLLGF